MTPRQQQWKRGFDLVISVPMLVATGPLIVVLAYLARRDTGGSGIFRQTRIGRHGVPFEIMKLRTMRVDVEHPTNVTTSEDPRITPFGAWLRRTKLDELPQLVNVVKGDMSLVGPRPDVEGWYDLLTGTDRRLLDARPGITGPATLLFSNEEAQLTLATDPEKYNRDVIWPQKVARNLAWLEDWSLRRDVTILLRTILPRTRRRASSDRHSI